MDEAAGIVGIDPERLTLRRLWRMCRARRRHDWLQTAALMAMTAEIHRDRKKRRKPFTAADFDPFQAAQRTQRLDMGKDISFLKHIFLDNQDRVHRMRPEEHPNFGGGATDGDRQQRRHGLPVTRVSAAEMRRRTNTRSKTQ